MAIFLEEADSDLYLHALVEGQPRRMSVANWLEVAMVLGGRAEPSAHTRFDLFMERVATELVPISVEHAFAAREGWRRFGRGNHSARLNYGDCFAYALAKTSGEPLLFKGNDFAQTDIKPAI